MKVVDLKTFMVGAAWRNPTFIRLETDEEAIRAHPLRDGFFNLWDPQWHKRSSAKGS